MSRSTLDTLDRLESLSLLAPGDRERLLAHDAVPWWLAALQTLAAWIASLLLLSSFFAPAALIGDGPLARGIAGALLCVLSISLFRRDKLFTNQMALALSLAGQALLLSSVSDRFDDLLQGGRTVTAFGALIALGMMLPRANLHHRTICALLALCHLALFVGPGAPLELLGTAVVACAAFLWSARPAWVTHRHAGLLGGLARAAGLAALIVPLAAGLPTAKAWLWFALGHGGPVFAPSMLSFGIALTFLATVAHCGRGLAPATRAVVLGCAGLLAFLAQAAPGVLAGATLFLACFQGTHRPLATLGLAAAVAYLGSFYYSLETTLLLKSVVLAVSGLILLALRAWLLRHGPTDAGASSAEVPPKGPTTAVPSTSASERS